MERLHPDWSLLDSLHAPLTPGERALVKFLDANLPDTWSIFVQAYVNGLRPDVVVANPNVGVVVFEVKDWNLEGYSAVGNRLIGRSAGQEWTAKNPLLQARTYASRIYEQYLAGGAAEGDPRKSYKPQQDCRAAVYFHCASTEAARNLLAPWLRGDDIVFGNDWLDRSRLQQVVPSCYHKRRQGLADTTSDLIAKLIQYLMPPRHYIEQNHPLPMPDAAQAPKTVPGRGFHRLRGPAGCGKTLVLIHRALRANGEGRRVLVLSHNITMSHWHHDLLQRSPYRVSKDRQEVGHFHAWCIQQAAKSRLSLDLPSWKAGPPSSGKVPFADEGREGEEDEGRGNLFDEAFHSLSSALESGASPEDLGLKTYGGIYVDEAQDFEAAWLDLVARFLAPDGEMVIVADQRQDLFGREGGRDRPLRQFRVCRFRGPWTQLGSKSHRLSWRGARFLEAFSTEVGLGDQEDQPIRPKAEPTLDGIEHELFGWISARDNEHALDLLAPVLRKFRSFHPSDTCVLVPNHAWGLAAYDRVKSEVNQVVHVFSQDRLERQVRKKGFWMGRGELKMCTIHSFKGWQIENVVLVWPSPLPGDAFSPEVRHKLLYCAASRPLRNLVILNADRNYDGLLRLGGYLEELPAPES
ncbi:MAG: NERD domain-containing protein [Fimbriimonadaceae bacterium]